MKTLISFFALLISVISFGQRSIYHPFPDSNSSWNYYFQQSMCVFGTASEEYSFIISGDTTINSQILHKLSIPYVSFFTTGTCTQIHYPGYKGAIRQDVLNKKVYIVPPTSTTEELLYDFNMALGDTVQGYLASYSGTYDTVLLIDSVLVGNDYRKRWYINDWYEIYLIEGIGSTYGLLENSPGYSTDADYYNLNCYMEQDQTLYPDTNTNCNLITSIKDIGTVKDHVKIFPNPSKGSFSVEFQQPKDIKCISLEDIVGNKILQKEINGQRIVYLDNIPTGTYILTITDRNNGYINRKIISCL
jgi:hypothetical protein